ncbi:MAG: sulfatase-like hydrolase/transferase [Kiritimatiellaeota bacterium]|nr:sulfatase-like hydrolase/transferase [Kiritimatiellota bacterium]
MSGKTKKNVLFLFTDDQRFDTIQALGNDRISTPNIDELVVNGAAFTQAHIPCGTSGAVCMPSRAMLNTGRTLFHIEGSGEEIPLDHTTIGEHLRNNGYRTFGTGKWHNGRESFNRSFSDGSEIFLGGMADHWNVPAYNYDPTGKYDATRARVLNPATSNEVVERPCDHVTAGKHSSQMVCDAAIDFLETKASPDQPFYMYVSFLAPHDPRTMPREFLDMYDPEDIELPPNFMGGHSFDTGALRIRDELLAGFPRSPGETRRHIAEYYAMISHLDFELGRVVASLKKSGMFEDTIIILAGDNGLALGQHGLFGKQNCYEHSVRVPLIFAGPGIPGGRRTDAFVYLLDVFPTICALLGLEIPDSVEGLDLTNAMVSPGAAAREKLFFAYSEFQRAVKTGKHKLVEYVVDGKHNMTQLFDLEKDPWELTNLSGEPEYAGILKESRRALRECAEEWDDPKSSWGEIFWRSY